MNRWEAHPQEAFDQAVRAAEILQDIGNACSLVRLKTVVADAALDLALRSPRSSSMLARMQYLDIACDAIKDACLLAREQNDMGGEALAIITCACLTRIRDGNLSAAEADAHFGLSIFDIAGDLCLRAQSCTVLSDLHLAREDPSAARVSFRRAQIAAAESVLPALNLWVDHGLHAVEEFAVELPTP